MSKTEPWALNIVVCNNGGYFSPLTQQYQEKTTATLLMQNDFCWAK